LKTIQYYAQKLGMEMTIEQAAMFQKYQEILLEWNQNVNLTSITEPEDIALKHFADSILMAPFLKTAFENKANKFPNLSIIDVGTGAGFPGIPLKILFPELSLTLMDSLKKKIAFLDFACQSLGLNDCVTVHSRAEDGPRSDLYREKFDISIARAVASMPVLCEYCMPYVKVGGVFVAMKTKAEDEIDSAGQAIKLLGGEIETCHEFFLPESDIKRAVIVIRKTSSTPAIYPRKAGTAAKAPLGIKSIIKKSEK